MQLTILRPAPSRGQYRAGGRALTLTAPPAAARWTAYHLKGYQSRVHLAARQLHSLTHVGFRSSQENADFKWHKDSEDPELVERKEGKTIVSFTVGLSAEFGFKHRFEDENHGTVRVWPEPPTLPDGVCTAAQWARRDTVREAVMRWARRWVDDNVVGEP